MSLTPRVPTTHYSHILPETCDTKLVGQKIAARRLMPAPPQEYQDQAPQGQGAHPWVRSCPAVVGRPLHEGTRVAEPAGPTQDKVHIVAREQEETK